MKSALFASICTAITLLVSQAAYSHGDHTHDTPPAISEGAALTTALKEVTVLIEKGEPVEGKKLTKDWKTQTPTLFKKGEGYYVVSFNNPEQKKTLYVLMADYGKFYDANFSGKFEGIE